MYYRDEIYIHFTSNTICNHIKISHKCCSGLGCGIYINDGISFNSSDIKKEFEYYFTFR